MQKEKLIEILTNNFWSFGKLGEKPYTENFYFRPDFTIHYSDSKTFNESFWNLEVNEDNSFELQLLDGNHIITTKIGIDDILVDHFEGPYLGNDSTIHQLKKLSSLDKIEILRNQNIKLSNKIDDLKYQLDNQLFSIKSILKNNDHNKIHFAFIINEYETIDALVSIISEAQKDERFEVKVIIVDRLFRGDYFLIKKAKLKIN
jgi:hypothetical protein